MITSLDFTNRNNYTLFSVYFLSILLIFLSGILNAETIVIIQLFIIIFIFRKIRFESIFMLFILYLLLQGIINVFLGNDTLMLIIKQLFGISISLLYWSTCIENTASINELLYFYEKLTIVVSVIALIQFIALTLHISSLSSLSWLIKSQKVTSEGRVSSVFAEPSQFALIIAPIVFVVLYSLIGKERKLIRISLLEKIIILIAVIVASSTVGYIAMILSLLLILIEYGINLKQIAIIILGSFFLALVFRLNKAFNLRISDTWNTIAGNVQLYETNVSTQTLLINKQIALESFSHTLGLGSGIGSHTISFDKYIGYIPMFNIPFVLNKDDANSLFLRFVSELGVIGLLMLAVFIWHFRIRHHNIYKIISFMCLVVIIIRLLRSGHYFNCGFGLFITLYLRCYFFDKGVEKDL